jgi:hypothetical protein
MAGFRLATLMLAWVLVWAARADAGDWRMSPGRAPVDAADRALIGRAVCGAGGLAGGGLRCRRCPGFTGDAGSAEGLNIGNALHGRFLAGPGEQWLLDTDGCEPHFEAFGGVVLLGPVAPGRPGLKLIYYKPGFRLNDCVTDPGPDGRLLPVCSEVEMGQGVINGHVSAMDVGPRDITRWRLLRWYDNTGSDMSKLVAVTPVGVRRTTPDNGQSGLRIDMKVLQTTRRRYEDNDRPQARIVTLQFLRRGRRYYADRRTQGVLEWLGRLTAAQAQ